MFSQIHIVRKLNAPTSGGVGYIEQVLTQICGNHIRIVGEQDINKDTLIIAIGGDGTMLEAMRLAHLNGAVATGINLGKIGFLSDFPNDQTLIPEIHAAINEASHPIEQRIVLECHRTDKLDGDTTPYQRPAFNEFVISNKFSDNLIKYTLFIGDRCAGVHRANALIVGTPTGSTAYSLSAGGGLLLPSMEAMQIIPVAPISMTSRPIIVPSHEEVRISIETHGEWILKADGATLGTFENDLYIDTQVVISQSKHKVNILHSKHWSFFDMLTQKLGWKSN